MNTLFILLFSISFFIDEHPLPATFINNLFFLDAPSQNASHFILLDTAGPTYLFSDFVKEMGWQLENTSQGQATAWDYNDTNIQGPTSLNNIVPVRSENLRPPHLMLDETLSGIFGHLWFVDKIIKKDYKNGQISLVDDVPDENISILPLNRNEASNTGFAALDVEISGEVHPLLLQTGGFVHLSAEFSDSFRHSWLPVGYISESIYTKWTNENDWLVLRNGDYFYESDIIRAEHIRMGDITVPFAWFAVREDAVFEEHFSEWSGLKISGTLGAGVFSGRTIYLDISGKKLGISN